MNDGSVMEEIKKLKDIVENAKKVPFSRFVSVDKEELLKIIARIENVMPREMKKAFLIDRKKEEIIESAYKQSEKIIEQAKKEREQILSESEIIAEAKKEKEDILKNAREEANEIINEAENYSAKLFIKVEKVLEKAKNIIKEGRESFINENTTSKFDNK